MYPFPFPSFLLVTFILLALHAFPSVTHPMSADAPLPTDAPSNALNSRLPSKTPSLSVSLKDFMTKDTYESTIKDKIWPARNFIRKLMEELQVHQRYINQWQNGLAPLAFDVNGESGKELSHAMYSTFAKYLPREDWTYFVFKRTLKEKLGCFFDEDDDGSNNGIFRCAFSYNRQLRSIELTSRMEKPTNASSILGAYDIILRHYFLEQWDGVKPIKGSLATLPLQDRLVDIIKTIYLPEVNVYRPYDIQWDYLFKLQLKATFLKMYGSKNAKKYGRELEATIDNIVDWFMWGILEVRKPDFPRISRWFNSIV